MAWPFRRNPKQPKNLTSIGDPAVAAYFGAVPTRSGVAVTEDSSLALSAVWRAVNLISGTIASLPLKTHRDNAEGRKRVKSFLDNPAGPDSLTPYEWKQVVVAHLLLHGRAPLLFRKNMAGALIGLTPMHPSTAVPDAPKYRENGTRLPKTFKVTLADGKTMSMTQGIEMIEILGFSMDGWYGKSVITVARESFGTAIAGERAAANLFGNGFLQRGLVTPVDDDMDEDEAKDIKKGLDQKTSGWEHAGEIAFVNRKLKFEPWTMSAEDAQFLQSRQFSIEEVARWFGVPPFELMQTEKQTSWGTGIESQQRGLARGNLLGWTMRIEQRLSTLLSEIDTPEFDFTGMERPTPEQEIRLLLEQIRGGLISVNEARKTRNLPPVEGGDEMVRPGGSPNPGNEGVPS